MNQLTNISVLDLYFLAHLVGESRVLDEPHLHARLKPTRGDAWRARFATALTDYRAAVDRLLKESAEASRAAAGLAALTEETQHWRRHMEGVAREEANAALRDVLLRAVGWGRGSPRSSKEYKDFYVQVAASVGANQAALRALGASPAALEWAHTALTTEEQASLDVARERAEEQKARGDMRAAYSEALGALGAVFRGAETVRHTALFERDAAKLNAADNMLRKLDEALAQARVQSRARAEKGEVPGEVLEPVTPEQPAATG
jgi:hypothetical protein